MKHKLAVLASHPIQYQAPLFRKLAQHPQVDLTVYYLSDFGVREQYVPSFGLAFKWDIPLLEGYRHIFLGNERPRSELGRILGVANPRILTELVRHQYDALLIHGYASAADWLAVLGAHLTKTAVLFRGEVLPRASGSSPKRLVKDFVVKTFFYLVDAFLPIGSQSCEFYRCFGISHARTFLTPYSVDNDFFMQASRKWRRKAKQLKAELGLSSAVPLVVYSGKLVARKRPHDLLLAFERLRQPAALLFVGDGALRPELEAYSQDKGMKDVIFAGFQNQRQLPKYYSMADVFVLPSSFEPWGLVVNEAMCCGLPIITTDAVAAAADLVHEGQNGYVVQVGDIGTLVERLEELLRDTDKRKRMGEMSRQIISLWSYDACVRGIIRALNFACG